MENKRFFAYGCSFTSFIWPTWADIIGCSFDQYFNYGKQGAGNVYIFNALMETDQHHKITKDDLVIIEWSCASREDRYVANNWITMGGAANYYNASEMKKYYDFRGFVLRDLALIKAAKSFLDYTKCEYYFLSMVPILKNNVYEELFPTNTEDLSIFYKDILDTIKPSFIEVLGASITEKPKILYDKIIDDSHPLPSQHFDYISHVLPKFTSDKKMISDNFDKRLANVWPNGLTHKNLDLSNLPSKKLQDKAISVLEKIVNNFPEIDKGKKYIKGRL